MTGTFRFSTRFLSAAAVAAALTLAAGATRAEATTIGLASPAFPDAAHVDWSCTARTSVTWRTPHSGRCRASLAST